MHKTRSIIVHHAFSACLALMLGLAAVNAAQAQDRPRTSPTPVPKPFPRVMPSPTPSPRPTVSPDASLEDLRSRIRMRLFDAAVRRGRVGVKIVALRGGTVVFENDSEKYFVPASNMKNFTVAAAIEKLTPDFRFVTSVFAAARPDPEGTVRGDLRIFGRGDISISTAFFGTTPADPNTYFKGIDRLVDVIAAAGIRRVDGALVGDESYFRGGPIPDGWEWDDLQWYYGAELSSLPINDSAVDIAVTTSSVGGPCSVTISPPNPVFQVVNTCSTGSSGSRRTLTVTKRLDRNIVEVSGTLPIGDSGFRGSIAVSRPAEMFVALLKQRLEARGIAVTGGTRLQPPGVTSNSTQEIARLESPPLSLIAAKTMKPSQNLYTETLLWTLGEETARRAGRTGDSGSLGLGVVRGFLKEIGAADDGILQYDGSGLSRHDLITPSAVVALYTYMAKQSRFAQVWRDSLTIGGVDGTLRNRFKGTLAEGNMRGKTGTLDQVSALSGYVRTAAGEELVVSLVVNGVADPATRTRLLDDIVVYLANHKDPIEPQM